MTNYSQKPVEIEKLQPEDNNTQSIDANNKDSDIQESAQASSQYKIKR